MKGSIKWLFRHFAYSDNTTHSNSITDNIQAIVIYNIHLVYIYRYILFTSFMYSYILYTFFMYSYIEIIYTQYNLLLLWLTYLLRNRQFNVLLNYFISMIYFLWTIFLFHRYINPLLFGLWNIEFETVIKATHPFKLPLLIFIL